MHQCVVFKYQPILQSAAGEPELAVAIHVVGRPISVFMQRRGRLGLISEYGFDSYGGHSVPLLFHGSGHYDLLVKGDVQRPPQSKL
jgi:hypothetical protein